METMDRMERNVIRPVLLLLVALFPVVLPAQMVLTDELLKAAIVANASSERRLYKYQMEAQAAQSAGYTLSANVMEACADLAAEYNRYLDSFNEILAYAAQAYGFYTEIRSLARGIGELGELLDGSAANAFAVALSESRNDIYADIIDEAAGIIGDLRKLCLSGRKDGDREVNGYKMTESERLEILFRIRPKLKSLNRKIRRLSEYIRYTTLTDVWLELTEQALPPADLNEIAERCRVRWTVRAAQGSMDIEK